MFKVNGCERVRFARTCRSVVYSQRTIFHSDIKVMFFIIAAALSLYQVKIAYIWGVQKDKF